jgi:hypothetical protein
MNNRWIYAVMWLAVLAGFVFLRNRMVLNEALSVASETPSDRWSVPPLVTLPSDTMQAAYAAAHFSGGAYKAWMSYNDTLARLGDFLDPNKVATSEGIVAAQVASASLKKVSISMADSLSAAAATALMRLRQRLPPTSAELAEVQTAVTRMDSLVARANQVDDQYFATVDSLIEHLQGTRPSASDDGQMLDFDDNRDVAVYNRSFARMQSAFRTRNMALTELHDHTFELLRRLAALK